MNQKTAIYIRVSTHWQIDKDSLQVQRRELIAYSELVLNINDYVIFEDAGYSAKNTDRPEYQAMLKRLKTGEFSHLLVWKIDRISRNLLDFAEMYSTLKQIGVTFVSKNEQFDTSSAIGEAMLKIILVFAELERKMTSERVTAIMLSRANNGQWNGGKIPYGYSYNGTDFTINQQEEKIVKRIYNLYEERRSILYVTRDLNSLSFTTRSGNEWSTPSVYKILTNIWYIGSYQYNKNIEDSHTYRKRNPEDWITIPEHHQPIISHTQFDSVQNILKRNARGGAINTYEKIHTHIFAGLLTCGTCGNNMTATMDKRRANGFRPSIYGCSRKRANATACKDSKYVSDKVIAPFIFQLLSNIIYLKDNCPDNIKDFNSILIKNTSASSVENTADLFSLIQSGTSGLEYSPKLKTKSDITDNLKEKYLKTQTALSRLKSLYLYSDESMPETEYILEHNRLTSELQTLEQQLNQQPLNSPVSDNFMQKTSYFLMAKGLLQFDPNNYEKFISNIDPSIPKSFINNCIKNITITSGKITSVTFQNSIILSFT